MTHKAIVYSRHAAEMAKARRISRADVRWLIARGVRTPAPTLHGEQRWKVVGKVGKRELGVVFIERANDILLVTVEEEW